MQIPNPLVSKYCTQSSLDPRGFFRLRVISSNFILYVIFFWLCDVAYLADILFAWMKWTHIYSKIQRLCSIHKTKWILSLSKLAYGLKELPVTRWTLSKLSIIYVPSSEDNPIQVMAAIKDVSKTPKKIINL